MNSPRKIPGTQYTPPPDRPPISSNQYGAIKIYAGSASKDLGQEIAGCLGLPLSEQTIEKYTNENIFVQLQSSVREQDVYLVQSHASPVSDNIIEQLITLDTFKRGSAGRITAVIPYLAYARTDKKDKPRVPITSRMLADIIQVAGANRYILLDLHSGQIQGFFSVAGDVLTAFNLIYDYFAEKHLRNCVVVSADLGFAKSGRNYASKLDMPHAIIEKRRRNGKAEVMSLIGEVSGQDAIIIDDECDTAGSLDNAVKTVRDAGARDIYLAFTHPVLSGPAVQRLNDMNVKEIVTTNTLPVPKEKRLPNMTILSVGPFLAEVIRRTHEGKSVGELFGE